MLEAQPCFAINCEINAVVCEEPTKLLLLDSLLWGQKKNKVPPSKSPWKILKPSQLGVNKGESPEMGGFQCYAFESWTSVLISQPDSSR